MLAVPAGSRYLLLAEGPLEVEALRIAGPDAAFDAPFDDERQAEIARAVQRAKLRAAANGQSLFDSRLFRLSRVTPGRGTWQLDIGRTSYFEYVGTRSRGFCGDLDRHANPIGTGVIALTDDGYVPFGRRSRHVEVNPGRFFSFGGFFDADEDVTAQGAPCVASCVRRELREELGVEIAAADVRLQAIVYDLVHPHPEIVATVRLRGWRGADVAASQWGAELASLELVHHDDLGRFVREHGDDIAESLLGGLRSYLATQRQSPAAMNAAQ